MKRERERKRWKWKSNFSAFIWLLKICLASLESFIEFSIERLATDYHHKWFWSRLQCSVHSSIRRMVGSAKPDYLHRKNSPLGLLRRVGKAIPFTLSHLIQNTLNSNYAAFSPRKLLFCFQNRFGRNILKTLNCCPPPYHLVASGRSVRRMAICRS